MKPNCLITVIVYGLKIFGLAPFSYQIITLRKNPGTTYTVGGFRFSKIGMAYNILVVILIQSIPAFVWSNLGLANGSVLKSPTNVCHFVEFILTFVAIDTIIISSSFRQEKAVSFMNRLVKVRCLLSDVEDQPVSNKMTFVSFSLHFIFNLVFWISVTTTTLLFSPATSQTAIYSLMSILIYSFIMEYSVVLALLSTELNRANRNLLNIKELPNHSYSSQLSNDFLPVNRFPTKTHLDDVKLIMKMRTTLYELSREAAEFFSFPILVTITSIFFRIAFNSYYFTDCLINLNATCTVMALYDLLLILIILASPIVLLSLRVQSVLNEAKLTGLIIHKLLAAPAMREIKVELKWFSLQLLHERISFTGYDFFTLDLTILHSILNTAILYLIMFFQS